MCWTTCTFIGSLSELPLGKAVRQLQRIAQPVRARIIQRYHIGMQLSRGCKLREKLVKGLGLASCLAQKYGRYYDTECVYNFLAVNRISLAENVHEATGRPC
jgi:hypothetical protein